MKSLKCVFFGTPDFAVPSLRVLAGEGHDIRRVVTQPDRKRGRGRQLAPPPVKSAALEMGCPVLQPSSLREAGFAEGLKALAPDLFVVVAYGGILPAGMLSIPPMGAVNVHASLLPEYRGPAPIQWAIVNGEARTGVTTMVMDAGVDTGDILLQRETVIAPDDTAATLHDRLARLGAELLAETLEALCAGTLTPSPQDHDRATAAPMLKKADGRVDWRLPAAAIDAFVRGMTPWPGAFTFLDERRVMIHAARPVDVRTSEPPGTVIRGFDDELRVATGKGALAILELQAAAGRRLPADIFLQGCPLPPGTRFA